MSTEPGSIWTHAHSFRWGWLLFARKDRDSVAQLYAALRFVDDFVDEATPAERPHRFARVASWAEAAREGRTGGLPPPVASLIARKISSENWAEFFEGQHMDSHSRPCPSDSARGLYCQRVAGVVGLMFCDLLGIGDPSARQRAGDLGRAMQLTNMARDVVEDARRGRSYLTSAGPDLVLQTVDPQKRAAIETEVLAWLKQADAWYESGFTGLRFLPLRAALGVAVGARLYRAIGDKITRDPALIWRGRVRTGRFEKVSLGLQAVFRHLGERLMRRLP